MLLADFFNHVYRPIRLLGRSGRTVVLYDYTIRIFGESLGRPALVSDLTDESVARHLQRLLTEGRSPAGVNKERAQLVALWNLAARKRLAQDFPEIRKAVEPERIPHAWTADQLWRLRISCNMQKGTYCGVPAGKWWVALHLLLYCTGERISAVRQLTWDNVVGSTVIFPAETRKGSRKANICQLSEPARESLDGIRKPDRELVFAFPYSSTYLYRLYHDIIQRAELPAHRQSKFHAIRRTHATHLKAAGGDPTASLGHSNPQTTQAYLDPRQLPKRVVGVLPDFPESTRAG